MICKVCGRYFRAKAENKYLVTTIPTGIKMLVEGATVYECFDCPRCGCQNRVNTREGAIPREDSDG